MLKTIFIRLFPIIGALGLLGGLPLDAPAQGGFGFGIGTGSWYGPGAWGGGGRYNGGGFYGMGVTVGPGHTTAPITHSHLLDDHPATTDKSTLKTGTLEGVVKLCPPQNPAQANNKTANATAPPANAKPSGPCAASQAELEHVAIVASPYGLSQWVGTQPDATGHYRLTLIPGGYLIQASNPEFQNQRPVEVIVEPGKATYHDFQLGP